MAADSARMLSPSASRFRLMARISFSSNEGMLSLCEWHGLTRPSIRAQAVRVTQTRTFPIRGEASLGEDVRALLREVGTALDQQRPLRVHVYGLITVDELSPVATQTQENGNERQSARRSSARSRKRTARRQGAAIGPWAAGTSPRLGGDVLRACYEEQMKRLAEAYPTLQTFLDDDGMWLLAKSSVIPGLPREATFLIALPYKSGPGPRAWGFWTDAAGHSRWIGPRHTNFRDGSICAFSPNEGAWSEGCDLTTLLDLYSVWALRHLHLEVIGRWPGKQYGLIGADPNADAYYRQRECRDDELCGCGSERRRYADCCKASDLRCDFIESASLFLQHTGGFESRVPPPSVVSFVQELSAAPKMAEVHLQLRCVA